jgi:hypothetical protein
VDRWIVLTMSCDVSQFHNLGFNMRVMTWRALSISPEAQVWIDAWKAGAGAPDAKTPAGSHTIMSAPPATSAAVSQLCLSLLSRRRQSANHVSPSCHVIDSQPMNDGAGAPDAKTPAGAYTQSTSHLNLSHLCH